MYHITKKYDTQWHARGGGMDATVSSIVYSGLEQQLFGWFNLCAYPKEPVSMMDVLYVLYRCACTVILP